MKIQVKPKLKIRRCVKNPPLPLHRVDLKKKRKKNERLAYTYSKTTISPGSLAIIRILYFSSVHLSCCSVNLLSLRRHIASPLNPRQLEWDTSTRSRMTR